MHQLRLTHPELDFWIDVRLRHFEHGWLAVADLADTPEIGTGDTAVLALSEALAPFPPELRAELVSGADLRELER